MFRLMLSFRDNYGTPHAKGLAEGFLKDHKVAVPMASAPAGSAPARPGRATRIVKLAITVLRFSLAVLIATASARRATAVEEPFHFQYDIAPQLARAGCAAAECHGGATGRGGFKLSLFATNPRADFEAITQDLGGRRVNYPQPELSLLLRKPARQLKHGGGRVIDLDDASYAALHRWIKEGAPFARGDSGTLTALGLARDSQHLSVTATFTLPDGRSQERDVTGMARFESTDDRVAAVDEDGRVEIRGYW